MEEHWRSIMFLARVVPKICHNINRVVFAFGEPVLHPVQDITPTLLVQSVVHTLRKVDAIANKVLRDTSTRLMLL